MPRIGSKYLQLATDLVERGKVEVDSRKFPFQVEALRATLHSTLSRTFNINIKTSKRGDFVDVELVRLTKVVVDGGEWYVGSRATIKDFILLGTPENPEGELLASLKNPRLLPQSDIDGEPCSVFTCSGYITISGSRTRKP